MALKSLIDTIKNHWAFDEWMEGNSIYTFAIRGDDHEYEIGSRLPESKNLCGIEDIKDYDRNSLEDVGGTCAFKIEPNKFNDSKYSDKLHSSIAYAYRQAEPWGCFTNVIFGEDFGRKEDIGPVAENEVIVKNAELIFSW
jgi:hypothetical protein